MTDDEIEQYLATILATTLILKDGTRLKPVFIEWGDLTPQQRDLTIQRIKQVAVAELKKLENGQRLRLEFDHIPDELEGMLRDLASPDQESFEWAEVAT
jgi:hypothetical protein